MRWASAFSSLADARAASEAAAGALSAALGDGPVDLAIAFFGAQHVGEASAIAEVLKARLVPACLIGGSAHGVISSEHEVEGSAALSVIAARLPAVGLHPFIVSNETWSEAAGDPLAFARIAPGAM